MGRLIDVDKLIESLYERFHEDENTGNITSVNFGDIIVFCKKQPIDYDIGKVVEQLEEMRPEEDCFDDVEDYEYALNRHNKIVGIVIGGKVDEVR